MKTSENHLSKFINSSLWIVFLANISYLILKSNEIDWSVSGIFRVNSFTILIWTVVSFFSALINSYSQTYLQGFKFHARFTQLTLGFTISVMLFVASDNIGLFILCWFAMGYFMAKLIGTDKDWAEAQEASKFSFRYFVLGTLFLALGILILAYNCRCFSLSEITAGLGTLSSRILLVSACLIILAAIIQSAIYPFHRWLLSAMTAPTPASALMHAGFVNAAGILLTLFSTLFFATGTLTILFVIGGITAIIAQFTKLLQVTVKQKLACSTIAQMGFMIMQCGLGFFNAAIVHLILHGFYKAYLFLSSGENIEASAPEKPAFLQIRPLQAIAVVVMGLLGALLFATLTGKGTSVNSSIFLTLIVAITVGQATYNIVKQKSMKALQKLFLPIILFFSGIVSYALIYNGVTKVMKGMPNVEVPSSLSFLEISFGIAFLLCFFIMKLGVYRKVPFVYVMLLNVSQPFKKTILMFNKKSI